MTKPKTAKKTVAKKTVAKVVADQDGDVPAGVELTQLAEPVSDNTVHPA